jgi:hypothetical protein
LSLSNFQDYLNYDTTESYVETGGCYIFLSYSVSLGKYFYYYYYYYLVCEAIATSATPGLLCQPRLIVKMIVEKQMECRFAGETEVLGENLPQHHFFPSQNPT